MRSLSLPELPFRHRRRRQSAPSAALADQWIAAQNTLPTPINATGRGRRIAPPDITLEPCRENFRSPHADSVSAGHPGAPIAQIQSRGSHAFFNKATLRLRQKEGIMLKFIGGTIGIIFLIGLLVVIGLLALIF